MSEPFDPRLLPFDRNGKFTVLIVDDVPENLNVLGGVLQPYYHVRVANSGQRGLQVARSTPQPDLILLDVMMPDLDGYAVLERLRADPLTARIPVIFVTALDSTEDEEQGLKLGAVDYIAKPIRPGIVLARIASQLQLKQARDWLADQNAFLEAEIRRRTHENLLIQDVSIMALANLAETRDPETGNHIRRTQGYVEALAHELKQQPRFAAQLTPKYIGLLGKAAPLHDLGKVGIPDHILLKPGKLTAEEFEIMKRHAAIGALAIENAMRGVLSDDEMHWLNAHTRLDQPHTAEDEEAPLAFLGVAKEIAHHHHEKWDGSGYPDGLAGTAIPLPARLMALADVFDALINKRVYKPAFSFDTAVSTIRDGRGSHFDPDIVDAFLRIEGEFRRIAERYSDDPT